MLSVDKERLADRVLTPSELDPWKKAAKRLGAGSPSWKAVGDMERRWFRRHLVYNQVDKQTIGRTDEDYLDNLELDFGEVIGAGAFGEIWKVRVKEEFWGAARYQGYEEFVMKKMEDCDLSRTEVEVGKCVSGHPNIVRYLGVTRRTGSGVVYLGMELLRGPCLADMIESRFMLSEAESLSVMREVTGAVSYMHSKGVAHLDIKPENVVLSRSSAGDGLISGCRLLDFGLSKMCPEGTPFESKWFSGIRGTLGYMSLEQVIGVDFQPSKGDVFSLGVMWYFMVTGETPFGTDFGSLDQLPGSYTQKLDECRYVLESVGISAQTTSVLLQCLHLIPGMRPDANALASMILGSQESGT